LSERVFLKSCFLLGLIYFDTWLCGYFLDHYGVTWDFSFFLSLKNSLPRTRFGETRKLVKFKCLPAEFNPLPAMSDEFTKAELLSGKLRVMWTRIFWRVAS